VSHVLSILFGAAFTVAVMWAIGRLLFRSLRIRLYSVEHRLLAAITGGALLSFSIFILCAIGAARTPVFLVLGISALALNWRYGAAPAGDFAPLAPLPRLSTPWKFLFSAPFAFYAVLYLSNSLAPEFSPDGQTYHLGLVYRYFREHGFHRLTTNMYSNLPMGLEMIFLFAFAFGRHSAAATVHCCYLLALPVLILNYARRIGRPRTGVCAAMIVYLSPVVGIDGVSAYNDVALGTTAFALFFLLEIWREKQEETNDRLLIPIGLLAGFCVAIKLTGFVAPLYTTAVILMRKRPKALIPISAAAATIFLPWPIKDWLWLGNPVSPFFNRIFPNPYIHVEFEDLYRAYLKHYELTCFRPWFRAVTTGGDLGGQVGPLFLLAPLALLGLRSRAGRHCLVAALFFVIPYPLNIGARFLIPALPFIALGMALAFEFSQAASALLIAGAAVLGWPGVIDKYRAPAGSWQIVQMPWQAALRIVPQDVFLRSRSVPWISASMLDYFVPKGKRVWSTTPVGEAYCNIDVMVNYQSAEGDLIEDMLTMATRDDLAPTWNLRFTFPKRRIRHLRLAQTAAADHVENEWSIGEVRIFNGQDRISPTPSGHRASWQISAKPFPWDIGLAFDNNPITRWRSWEMFQPGMHVDVDFGVPTEIDRVELHSSHDQAGIEVHPEVCDGGACTAVHARLDKLEDPPAGDLRRLATQNVKARGIDYLLVDDANWTAADMSKDPERWGMDFIAERARNRLYRIQ
jgi:hypothetical protein